MSLAVHCRPTKKHRHFVDVTFVSDNRLVLDVHSKKMKKKKVVAAVVAAADVAVFVER